MFFFSPSSIHIDLRLVPRMASEPQTTPNTSLPAFGPIELQEAIILPALDISPYELAFLGKHLLDNDWIPNTADEKAINDAVFDLCESFHANNRYEFPGRVHRLNFLFRAYSDEEEMRDPDNILEFQEARDRRLSRETAKYNTVRSFIADLTMRKNGVRDRAAQAMLEYVRDVFSCPLSTMA
jgi:hypothetical protein